MHGSHGVVLAALAATGCLAASTEESVAPLAGRVVAVEIDPATQQWALERLSAHDGREIGSTEDRARFREVFAELQERFNAAPAPPSVVAWTYSFDQLFRVSPLPPPPPLPRLPCPRGADCPTMPEPSRPTGPDPTTRFAQALEQAPMALVVARTDYTRPEAALYGTGDHRFEGHTAPVGDLAIQEDRGIRPTRFGIALPAAGGLLPIAVATAAAAIYADGADREEALAQALAVAHRHAVTFTQLQAPALAVPIVPVEIPVVSALQILETGADSLAGAIVVVVPPDSRKSSGIQPSWVAVTAGMTEVLLREQREREGGSDCGTEVCSPLP